MSCSAEEEEVNHRKRYWIRPFLNRRRERGDFCVSIPEMIQDDSEMFFETFRMTPETFDVLLSLIGPRLQKNDLLTREPISASQRLQISLAYLVSGDQQKSIAKNYRVGKSTVCGIIHETVEAIYVTLQPKYLKVPNLDDYKEIAKQFEKEWQFTNCVGAIDGKHFEIPAPHNSGSTYYNYKGYFSVIMLASCDADYNFVRISVGSAGSESDAGIFQRSNFGKQMLGATLPLPEPSHVTGTSFLAPYVYVADEAFPLLPHLVRPFPGVSLTTEARIFNYRLSRARRIIENCFGILIARWRILYGIIQMQPNYASDCIKACVVLHNFLRRNSKANRLYCPAGFLDSENPMTGEIRNGIWRTNSKDSTDSGLGKLSSNNYSKDAANIRQEFLHYFNGVGAVQWQTDRILYS